MDGQIDEKKRERDIDRYLIQSSTGLHFSNNVASPILTAATLTWPLTSDGALKRSQSYSVLRQSSSCRLFSHLSCLIVLDKRT